MNEFMKVLLSLSVSGALLSLLIWGWKPLYKNRLNKGWQYYIWIIAVLRFLLPFTLDTSIVGGLSERVEAAVIRNEIFVEPEISIAGNMDHKKTEPVQTDMNGNRNATVVAARGPFNRYDFLFLIWVIPAIVLFARKMAAYQGFIRYMKAGNREASDIKILNLLSDWEEKLNIKTKVELYHNSLIDSPMLIGFFRPGIILPARKLGDKELSYIFVHELTHYKQRDIFYKWLIQIVVSVHWFNPFVYLLEREVNRSCELSCDEKVLSVLDDSAKREYGDMLISFLKPGNPCRNSLASVTLTEGAEQLKERLRAIRNFRKKSKGTVMAAAVFIVTAGFLFFAAGAYAAPSAVDHDKVWRDNESEEAPKYGITGIRQSADKKSAMTITHESADILYYEDGSPYIHGILANHMDRTIIEAQYCMLAYDENGSPLKLYWNFLDSSAESSFENVVRTKKNILPGQTEKYRGGWSLYDDETMKSFRKTGNDETKQAAYALLCLKQVVFEDGSVWDNPDYEDWFEIYAGKETDTEELQNYYPHEYSLGSD